MTVAWEIRTLPLEPFQARFRLMDPAQPLAPGRYPKDAANTIAERLGWYNHQGHLDGPRVRRTLGLRPEPCRPPSSAGKLRKTIGSDLARQLCEAMEIPPVDVGL